MKMFIINRMTIDQKIIESAKRTIKLEADALNEIIKHLGNDLIESIKIILHY